MYKISEKIKIKKKKFEGQILNFTFLGIFNFQENSMHKTFDLKKQFEFMKIYYFYALIVNLDKIE